MYKSCPKHIFSLVLTFLFFLFLSSSIHAAITINSVTLNGSSTVTVEPSASITAAVNVTTTSGTNWNSTSWNISGSTCVDHTNHTASGTYNESFSATAPSAEGTYSISFIASANNTCTGTTSTTYTMTNAITVAAAPTPTPTPVSGSTPTPTPVPGTTPTPTPTPSSSSSSTSTSTTTYYPSITMTRQGTNFIGTATIEDGDITAVEYSLDLGITWLNANPQDGRFNQKTETFSFTPNLLGRRGSITITARAKSLAQIYTQSSQYATLTLNLRPPQVSAIPISSPTKDTTPTLSAKVTPSLFPITSGQFSLDQGSTWQPATLSSNQLSTTLPPQEDSNLSVIFRAFDSIGNVGTSDPFELVIDTLPPIIGGGSHNVGPQTLTPNQEGKISLTAGSNTTFVLNLKGGVTQATVSADTQNFELTQLPGTNLWQTKLAFTTPGEKTLTVSAIDGANNITTRTVGDLSVTDYGHVLNQTNNQPLNNAIVTLYSYQHSLNRWLVWEAAAFSQQNPQTTNQNGEYSYMVPPGRYYLKVSSPGYRTLQSDIFEFSEIASINLKIPLQQNPSISLKLPFIGNFTFSLPTLIPDTVPTSKLLSPLSHQVAQSKLQDNSPAPDFTLPDLSGKNHNLSQYLGKKILLTFLSAWTPTLSEQLSTLTILTPKLDSSQHSLTVFVLDSSASVDTLLKRGRYSLDPLIDTNGITTQSYNLLLLPRHHLIDSTGIIKETFVGNLDADSALEKLNKLQ